MNAASLLVECLEQEGIEFVFGVPGEENADFLLALAESDQIRFVLTRHEQGAAFMGDVYGRLTGNPAVALSTLGPGATNLVTGVANANMDRSPLIVITGQGDVHLHHKESHQVIDVVGMFRPITKWAHAIRHPDTIPEVVRKAVRLSRSEKPGAVHLELSEDIARRSTEERPLRPHRFRRPSVDESALEEGLAMLQASTRPVIIAGNGTIRRRASRQLRRFCELTSIGVVSTFMAKGCVSSEAEYCLFSIGLQQHDQVSRHVDESDLVITIGYDMAEYPPRLWNHRGGKPIVHIDFVPAEIDAHYHPEVELIGDISQILETLVARLNDMGVPRIDRLRQAETRRSMQADFAEFCDDDTESCVRPQKVLWDVKQVLGPNDLLLCGVGAHKMWVGRYYHCQEPNTCLMSNGFCSMGMPLPGAIAAHLVDADRRVLAIVGDGDFLMNVQEMETARRLDTDITVMVWEDHDFGLVSWKQDLEFGHHVDMTFGNPDWHQLADAFGWRCWRVNRSRDVLPSLLGAFEHRGPSLVVVPIDYRENRRMSERLGAFASRIG